MATKKKKKPAKRKPAKKKPAKRKPAKKKPFKKKSGKRILAARRAARQKEVGPLKVRLWEISPITRMKSWTVLLNGKQWGTIYAKTVTEAMKKAKTELRRAIK